MTTVAKLVKAIKTPRDQPLTVVSLKSFLADTRRLLEVTGQDKKYETLNFHCDWILHTKMSRAFASRFLREFDEVRDAWITKKLPIPPAFAKSLPYKIGFYGFEKELVEVLGPHGIGLPDPGVRNGWQLFEQVYCEMVDETELEYELKKKEPPLKHVNGAQVKRFRMDNCNYPEIMAEFKNGDFLPYGIEWIFTKNGQSVFALPITFPSNKQIEREKQEAIKKDSTD
jgi:hypothetical protein